jgi:hypothetical protein
MDLWHKEIKLMSKYQLLLKFIQEAALEEGEDNMVDDRDKVDNNEVEEGNNTAPCHTYTDLSHPLGAFRHHLNDYHPFYILAQLYPEFLLVEFPWHMHGMDHNNTSNTDHRNNEDDKDHEGAFDDKMEELAEVLVGQ